jgi:hypothetical protein
MGMTCPDGNPPPHFQGKEKRVMKADLLEDGPHLMVSILSLLQDLQPQVHLSGRF